MFPQVIAETVASGKRWASRVTLSVADQGLASGGHFVLNVLLARWLTPSEFGAFAVAFAAFLFAWGIHNAVLIEPMSILGPMYDGVRLPGYLGIAVLVHAGLTIGLAAVLLVIAGALALAGKALSSAMFAASFACPFLLLFSLLRRACYLKTKPGLALKGSALYFFMLLAGIWAMRRFGMLSAVHGFALMGVASLGVSLLFCVLLGVRLDLVKTASGRAEAARVVKQHWAQARWFLRTTMLYWLASSTYLPLVGMFSGLDSVAGFRAIDNLFRPMAQTLTALNVLFVPWASARREREGTGGLKRTALKTSAVMFVLTGSYVAAILLGGRRLIELLYGKDYYGHFLPLVPLLGMALILRGIGDNGLGVASKAAKWPDILFWATLASAGVTVSAGVYLTSQYGAAGAAAGWMAASAVHVAVTAKLFHSRLQGRQCGRS